MPIVVASVRQIVLWWSVWLLAAAVAGWLTPRWPGRMLSAAAAAAVVCLIVDAPSALLPQAAWLGLATGIVVTPLRARLQRLSAAIGEMRWRRAAVAALLLAPACGLCAPRAHGADDDRPAVREPLPRVLLPIDAEGEEAGEEVYAQASLIRRLEAQAVDDPYASYSVRLDALRCDLRLPPVESNPASNAPHSTLTITGDALNESVALRLPLDRSQADWIAAASTLDGRPAEIRWDDVGCEVQLRRAGPFELRLAFDPIIRRAGVARSFALSTPRTASCELRIWGLPKDAPFEAPAAVEIQRDDVGGDVRATLENVSELAASWQRPLPASRQDLRLEQLGRLSILPAGSRLDVLFRLSGKGYAPAELEFEAPPTVEMIDESAAAGPPGVRAVLSGGNRLTIHLPSNARLPLEVPLTMRLKRNVSIGRIDFPRIHPLTATLSRKWLAASIDESLSFEQTTGAGFQSMSVDEFAATWGPDAPLPTVAHAVTGRDAAWTLRVWPRPEALAADQSIELLCEMDHAAVEYAAIVAAQDDPRLMHRIEIPPALQEVNVAVRAVDSDAPIGSTWSRSDDGELTVLLNRPTREAHAVRIVGRLPTTPLPRRSSSAASASQLSLPRFRLLDAARSPVRLDLFRRRGALVRWQADAPPQIESSPPQPVAQRAFVGRYQLSTRTPSEDESLPALQIERNRVEAKLRTATVIAGDADQSQAELFVEASVKRGALDQLVVAAPPQWDGPFTVEPAGVAVVRAGGDQSHRRNVDVYLAAPLSAGQSAVIRIHGRLAPQADRRIRAPELRVVNFRESARYLVLPKRPSQPDLRWEWEGIHHRRLTGALADAVSTTDGVSFRIVGARFSAEQRVRPQTLQKVRIRAAELDVSLDASGEAATVCRFVLQPAAANDFALQLAPGTRLQSLTVAGRPLLPSSNARQAFSLPLSMPLMPVEIVVGYQERLRSTWQGVELRPPRLLASDRPLPMPHIRWRITAAEGYQYRVPLGATPISPTQFAARSELARMRALEDASLLALQMPIWEARQWFDQWRPYLPASHALQSSAAEPRANWKKLQENLGYDGSEPTPPDRGFALRPGRAVRCFATEAPSLQLQTYPGRGWQRWLLAATIAAAVTLAWRRRDAFERFGRAFA